MDKRFPLNSNIPYMKTLLTLSSAVIGFVVYKINEVKIKKELRRLMEECKRLKEELEDYKNMPPLEPVPLIIFTDEIRSKSPSPPSKDSYTLVAENSN